MSPLDRALLRLLPTAGTVRVDGPVPPAAAAALTARGTVLAGADGAADATVLVVALTGPRAVALDAVGTLARRDGRFVASAPLRDDDGALHVLLAEDDAGDPAAVALAEALVGAVDLLGAEADELAADRDRHRAASGDRGQRLRAAQQATRQAERIVGELVRGLARDLAGELATSDAVAEALSRSVLVTGGPTARVVAALRGEASRLAPTAPRRPPALGRSASPLPDPTGGRGSPRGPASGVRVSVLGGDALDLVAGAVRVRPLAGGVPAGLAAGTPLVEPDGHDHLEALVVGPALPDGWDPASARRLVGAARDLGAGVVGVRPDPSLPTWFEGLVDVEVTAGTDPAAPDGPTRVTATRPVPTDTATPRGFVRRPTHGLAVVPAGPLAPGVVADLRAAVEADRSDLTVLLPSSDEVAPPAALDGAQVRRVAAIGLAGAGAPGGAVTAARPDAVVAAVRDHRAVLDHPALHADHHAHAHWLAGLALARVPVRLAAALPAPVRAMLGDRVADALSAVGTAELDDPTRRELATVRVLRAAWPRLTPAGTWARVAPHLGLPAPRATSVSMVLATNRPDHLEHAVRQAAAQRWPARELVVVLHGDAFDGRWPDRVRDTAAATTAEHGLADLPITVLRADASTMLGPVLDLGCDAAAGDVVTKVDDDDHYSPDHLTDLLAAREHAGATVVAKGAEFTHLAEIDLTIRRMADGGESSSRSLAGGTFLLSREDLRAVGGWPRTPRFVDQRLLDAVAEAGGDWYRTHGFGFVLNRHGTGHTWDAGVDYFLRQSVTQHPGLALDVAGVTD